ncbi:MAG: response regulator, partial [Blastocatellia bacterium]|nr:response regulator [Blastocatellia bacterium]
MKELMHTDSGTVNVLPNVAIQAASTDEGGQMVEKISSEAALPGTVTGVAFRDSNSGSKRVLVADDDPLTLRMLTAIVEAEGYKAVMARDGQEVVDILKNDVFFMAALFDMWMPHIQGMELIRIMKSEERLKHIPVALISSERDLKIWSESVAAGASIFIPKPFSPSHVQMALRMLASKQ